MRFRLRSSASTDPEIAAGIQQRKLDRKLYNAAKAGQKGKVVELLEAGGNPNAQVGKRGLNAMQRIAASKSGKSNLEEIEAILEEAGGIKIAEGDAPSPTTTDGTATLLDTDDEGLDDNLDDNEDSTANIPLPVVDSDGAADDTEDNVDDGASSTNIMDQLDSAVEQGVRGATLDNDQVAEMDAAGVKVDSGVEQEQETSNELDNTKSDTATESTNNSPHQDSEAINTKDGDNTPQIDSLKVDSEDHLKEELGVVSVNIIDETAADEQLPSNEDMEDNEDLSSEKTDTVGKLNRPRRSSTFSIQFEEENVVVKDLRASGRLAASNVTQMLIRERRSTRHGPKGKNMNPETGDAPTDHYDIETELGKGAFGAVSLVKHKKTGLKYAMKHIDLERLGGASINLYLSLREIELMKKMDHPNVIKLFEVFRDDDNIFMVLELCMGRELEEVLGNLPLLATRGGGLPPEVPRFPEERARELVQDMLSALSYIHANGIVHRDIKLENYVFSGPNPGEGTIKLIDFGLSRACLESVTMTQDVGSLVYKAPEIATGAYTELSDLWSFGMVCHMILTGIVPWEGTERAEIAASIQRELSDVPGFHSFLAWMASSSFVSDEAASFVTGLLTPDPAERLTCATARQHPWITGSVTTETPTITRNMKRKASLLMVQKLKEFRNNDALKRTVLLAMSFGVASAEMVELGEAFKRLDADQDGLLGWDEFNTALISYGSEDETENREIFEAINQDGTGKIKYSEFVASQLEKDVYDANVQLEAAFHRLDFNNDGKIGLSELELLLHSPDGDEKETRAEALQVLTALDKDEDGEIDIEEFKIAMRGVFSPEEIAEDPPDSPDTPDSPTAKTPKNIGQFKLMQLRLASQLELKNLPPPQTEIKDDDKIGQFKLTRLLLASRLQFKEAPAENEESMKGQFKLRRLMLASQLQNFKPPKEKAAGPPPEPLASIKNLTAPGSFRRRLLAAQETPSSGSDVSEDMIRRRGTATART